MKLNSKLPHPKQLLCKDNLPKTIYFVGIGGAGMAPLAGIVLECGVNVFGADIKTNNKIKELAQQGAVVYLDHVDTNITANIDLVVFSSAVSPDNPELQAASEFGIPCLRRGDFLARFLRNYSTSVAINGSHGKTTVTAMLVWMLKQAKFNIGYMVGGEINGCKNYSAGDGNIFVTEVDESDGSNALVHADLGVIVNIDDDHSWSVGGQRQLMDNFQQFGQQSSSLLYCDQDRLLAQKLFIDHLKIEYLTDYGAFFNSPQGNLTGFMRTNAMIACVVASKLGVDINWAWRKISKFPGVKRRMTLHYNSKNLIVIEDYAHHPTEVKAAIDFLRENYAGYELNIVFQPHRFARLAKYLDLFAQELSYADKVFIAPVFAAWVEKGKVNLSSLKAAIRDIPVELISNDWRKDAGTILQALSPRSLVVVLGAGDIEALPLEIVKVLSCS